MEGVAHVEPLGEQPTAFGAYGRSAGVKILRYYMIDRTRGVGHSRGKDTLRLSEEELDKIGIRDVEVEQRASQVCAGCRRCSLLSPASHLAQQTEAPSEHFAI